MTAKKESQEINLDNSPAVCYYKSMKSVIADIPKCDPGKALEYAKEQIQELKSVARAMRGWIDAVPKDTVLPAMPGFDRDWADGIID